MASPVGLPNSGSNSSFGNLQGSPIGPFKAPNGFLYQPFYAYHPVTNQALIQRSEDDGASWPFSVTSPVTPALTATEAVLVGDLLYVLYWDIVNGTSDSVIKVYDTTSNSFLADITGFPTNTIGGGTVGAWTNARMCITPDGHIHLAVIAAVDGAGYGQIGQTTYSGSTWSAFVLMAGQVSGSQYYIYRMIATPGGNVYAMLGINSPTLIGGLPTLPYVFAYSKNNGAPIPVYSSLSIAARAFNEVIGVGCVWGSNKIAVPFLGGGGDPTDNQAPLFAPAPGVLCLQISNIDSAESFAIETVDTSNVILGCWRVYETLLHCVAVGSGLALTGVISTASGTTATLPLIDIVSVAGNIVLWQREAGTWTAPTVLFSYAAPNAASGCVPLFIAPSTLGLMFMVMDTSSGSQFAGASHQYLAVSLAPVPSVVSAQVVFQGVARFKAPAPIVGYQGCVDERSYTYIEDFVINQLVNADGSPNGPLRFIVPMVDYDFEFEQLIIRYQSDAREIPPTEVICTMQIFDYVAQPISNLPVLDIFYNGAPDSPYENGAMVPRLRYPKDGRIRVDLYSLVSDSSLLPITARFNFVGKKRIPA